MQDNEFADMLDKKIADLVERRREVTDRLLDGNFHAQTVAESINDALDRLEQLASQQELDMIEELLSLLQQVPGLVKSVWSTTIENTRVYDQEIARWKEMSAYYTQFTQNKKKEEEGKKKEEEPSTSQREQIANGDISEPTRMDAIRRQPGQRPSMRLSRFRQLSAEIDNEETTDADDSRG